MYYRSRYNSVRKRRGNRILIIVIAAIIITTVLTVIFGNYLKNKASDTAANATPVPDEVTVSEDDFNITEKAPDILAIPIDLSTLTAASVNTVVSDVANASYSGASIRLTDENGHPLYKSDVTSLFPSSKEADAPTTPEEKIDLRLLTSALHENGMRAIECFDVKYLKAENAAEEALRSYEIALIAELSTLGIDEIILFGFSVPGGEDAYHFEYIEKIKNAAPDLTISTAFDISVFESDSLALNMLLSRLDFITVEICVTNADDKSLPTDQLKKAISENLIIFTKYSPRVVMKYTDDETMRAQIQAAADNMLQSWQIY